MASATVTPCWICGNPAETREHRAKASDLRALLPVPSQKKPWFFHSQKHRSIKVGSAKSDVLKFSHRICQACNSTRTQPHDYAWQAFFECLRTRNPPIKNGQVIRCNAIFPHHTSVQMLRVHLYFAKLFGCQIAEGNINIGVSGFAKAILEERAHPCLYLAFGPNPDRCIGGSDVCVDFLDDQAAFATWFYDAGPLRVNVMYAAPGEQREGLRHAWHPRFGAKRLVMKSFLPEGEESRIDTEASST